MSSSKTKDRPPDEHSPFIERLARHARTSDAGVLYEQARLLSLVERGATALTGPWGDVVVRESSWDTDVLGVATGRIEAFRTEGGLPDPGAWAEALGVRHLSIRLPFPDVAGARVLEAAGFHLADFSLSLVYEGDAPKDVVAEVTIRAARESDDLELQQMARGAFTATRFHLDPQIGVDRAGAVYAKWTRDAVARARENVLVADLTGSPVGFVVCKFDPIAPSALGSGIGQLDLLAVGGEGRGKGVGRALANAALVRMLDLVPRVEVMTSAANASALRLYQKTGFILEKGISLADGVTLHWWGPQD